MSYCERERGVNLCPWYPTHFLTRSLNFDFLYQFAELLTTLEITSVKAVCPNERVAHESSLIEVGLPNCVAVERSKL